MDKVSFRKKQIDLIDDFMRSGSAQQEINDLYMQLFQNEEFINSNNIGITLSTNNEIPTFPIIKYCWDMGKDVYIPKTFSDYTMTFVKYTSETSLEDSSFGAKEPVDYVDTVNPPELLIVPGLAFSKEDNNRLGFGAGYYDRYLATYPTKTLALAMSKQYYLQTPWPVYVLDKSVDEIITVKGENNV
ncbi:5-formyltetrahydrofolate cyclo-ligase [Companilactobacillus keshanensis]|uniref:5-formyltetrahydrofolate cyclo-ligase n=1 Tax=Companilactobacillus keshanensis TaxID=2486003 RepID=A0ABW4BQW5_9LACO|nr:5-formyltetrahydrofolate cyclo-ligase [Companilactobacillus keshanensis]